AMTIVGVAPRGFIGTTIGMRPKVFVPITMRGLVIPGWEGFNRRTSYWAYLFARLKPGVTPEQAAASINVPYRALLANVEKPLQQGMSDQTMEKFLAKRVELKPGARGQSEVSQQAKTPLTLLMAVTIFVLLIACANIANLLLARGAARASEMAVRLSIGGSRAQLVTQLLVESCVLGLIGGVISLAVARGTLGAIAALLPGFASSTFDVHLDGTVVLFTAVLSLLTALAFGLFPALHATRSELVSTLRDSTGQPSGGRAASRWRTSLATAQITLSMALLGSAALLTRSLANVTRVDLGVKVDHVVTFGLSPELNAYTPSRTEQLIRRLTDQLRAMPGVTGVTFSLVPLIGDSNWGNDVDVEGFPTGPDVDNNSRFNAVGSDYFSTLGVPVLIGREFTAADAEGAPKVAVVNQTFAKKFGLGANPVGKRMDQGNRKYDTEIVGLVRDAKYSSVKDDIPPLFFTPYLADTTLGSASFYLRTSLDPRQLLPQIPKIVAGLDPNLPVEELRTMPEQIRQNIYLDRFISFFSAAFAGLATLLAAIGLYGVLAYTVSQRTREIGVRMALGADPASVRLMVLRQVGVMVLIGCTIGIGAAIAVGRLASSVLYKVNGYDPLVLGLSAIVLAVVALGAGLVPAARASRVDPIRALRWE
ncbi:MAG: ABC transporter permease, partial [Gemmatimonadales bacterium]